MTLSTTQKLLRKRHRKQTFWYADHGREFDHYCETLKVIYAGELSRGAHQRGLYDGY